MSLRLYTITMGIGTLLCWVAWFFVLSNIAPEEAGVLGFAFFYTSLFLAVLGTTSVFGLEVRRLLLKHDDVVFRHARHAFRQALLVALCVVLALVLQSKGIMTWWIAIGIVVAMILLEGVVFTTRKFKNVTYAK